MQSIELNKSQDYKIQVVEGGSYALSSAESTKVRFSAPASICGVGKLYTLSCARKLIYVGIAKQRMSARLNYGLKADGANGYHGYKWKHLSDALDLSIWTASNGNDHVSLREMEIIEAEVAFLCRSESEQWPEFQHEIHFFLSGPAHRAAAKEIYRHAIADRG